MSLSSEEPRPADCFILYVWPGEWNLPSLDPECLTALCFLKYSNVQHQVVTVNNPWKLFKNEYPKLEYNNEFYVGLEQIVARIKKEKNIDRDLNDQNYADLFALINLFKQKFIPAFNLLCWLDEDNTYTVIRKAYGKHLKFPLSIVKLKQMAIRAENSIKCNNQNSFVELDNLKQQIIFDAKECLNVFSSKLGDNLFTFENRPSLIDSYLFGYLSILSKAPFTNSTLKSHYIACSTFEALIKRIRYELFPAKNEKKAVEEESRLSRMFNWLSLTRFYNSITSKLNMSGLTSSTSTKTESKMDQAEEWEKRKNRLIAVGVAMTAMLTYAFAIGLIKVDIIKTDLFYVEKK